MKKLLIIGTCALAFGLILAIDYLEQTMSEASQTQDIPTEDTVQTDDVTQPSDTAIESEGEAIIGKIDEESGIPMYSTDSGETWSTEVPDGVTPIVPPTEE